MTVQAYMIVLCATWRGARGVYDLICEMTQRSVAVTSLLMYGASGDIDIDVRTLKLKLLRLGMLNSFFFQTRTFLNSNFI